jgi:hypothetical protein
MTDQARSDDSACVSACCFSAMSYFGLVFELRKLGNLTRSYCEMKEWSVALKPNCFALSIVSTTIVVLIDGCISNHSLLHM